MAVDISKGLFLSDGCVVRKDALVLAAGFNTDPDQETSRVAFIVDGEWRSFDIEVDAVISAAASGDLSYIVASKGSAFEVPVTPGLTFAETRSRIRPWVIQDVVEYGELTRVRVIAGTPYCCGTSGQVYRLAGSQWVRADHGLRSVEKGPDLEDIDGFAPSELYAVGTGGAMVRFDGKKWRRIDLSTNLNLSNVRCGPDDACYVCGDSGLVMTGHGSRWRAIGTRIPGKNYWGLEIFEGDVYLAHGKGIDRIVGADIEPVPLKIKGRLTFHRLHGGDRQLWSFGTDHLLKMEGGIWTRVELPFSP